MSECVVRMEMPTKENPCKIAVSMQLDGWTFWICPILNARCLQPEGNDCPRNCPIICQLSEGHGRLVDADALERNMFAYAAPEMLWDRGDIEHKIGEMPSIVPATEGEKK